MLQFVKVTQSAQKHFDKLGYALVEAVYCPALTPPDHGTVSISSGVNYLSVGSTATYSCDPGYALLGSTTRTCEDPDRDSVGTWTGSVATCQGEVLYRVMNLKLRS